MGGTPLWDLGEAFWVRGSGFFLYSSHQRVRVRFLREADVLIVCLHFEILAFSRCSSIQHNIVDSGFADEHLDKKSLALATTTPPRNQRF